MLSLFDIPIMHTYMDDLIRWLHRVFLKQEWTWPILRTEDESDETAL